MIESLNLVDFGKFKKHSFDFKPVTLFFGENEAGKSTIFDALFDIICAPKGNSAEGKRLKNRYGEDRKAEITGDSKRISESDFLNLYAVKSGPIGLAIDNNSEAMNTVKASLFSGGIDPRAAAASLMKTVAARGKDGLGERIKQANADISRLKSALDADYNTRKNYLWKESEIKEKDAKLREIEKKISSLEEAAAADEKALADQRLLKEEKQLSGIISLIYDYRRKNETLEKYNFYTAENLEKIKALENEDKERKNEFDSAAKSLENALGEANVKAKEKSAQENIQYRAAAEKVLADSLKDRIYPKEKLIEKKTLVKTNKVFIALSVLCICAGAFLFFIAPPSMRFLFPAGGIIIAAFFLILAFKKQVIDDDSRLKAEIESVRERWRKETNRETGENYEGILLALENASRDAEFARENYRRLSEEANRAEEKMRSLMEEKQSAENRHAAAKRALNDALGSAGVRDAAGYAVLLSKKENETALLAGIGNKIQFHLREYGAASIDALEDLLTVKIKHIRETVSAGELGENEFKRLENRLSEHKKNIAGLQKIKEGYISSVSGERGETNAVFGELPSKIAAEEKALAEAGIRLRELKTELRANEIAGEIFASLAEDTGRMLRSLSDEIQTVFSSFTSGGGVKVRDVGLKSFSMDGNTVTATDELGAVRDLVNLSAGTRDAFILAARLILAVKSRDGGKVPVIFDESFTALDRKRTERALKILEEFRKKTGWQIVIFTKDPELEKQAQAVFGSDLAVHRLHTEDSRN
jgi:DNA sulfur modification protein DndD